MSQVFSRAQVLAIKVAVLGTLAVVVVGVLVWRLAVAYVPAPQHPVDQPVPFSHKHHVGDVGLDCRYCHTSVERSAFAGIPPSETCMTCHSQLFTDQPLLAPLVQAYAKDRPMHWKRVHDLPDFVYFNHSAHVRNGVGCVSCHGEVDRMPLTRRVAPLTMQWCLACHRDPAPHLRPRDEVFDLHWQPEVDRRRLGSQLLDSYHIDPDHLTDCSVCHR